MWLEERLAGLSPGARNAVLVAAVDDLGEVATVVEAVTALGGSIGDLEEAELHGIVRTSPGVVFAHPLLRSSAISTASPSAVRAAHRSLADVLEPRSELDDRAAASRAWHLASAARGHDPTAAEALAAFAERSLAQGANVPAARALERASTLAGDPRQRVTHHMGAIAAWSRAGEFANVRELLRGADSMALTPPELTTLGHYWCAAFAWVDTETALLRPAQRARELEADSVDDAVGLWFTIGVHAVFAASHHYVVEAQQRIAALTDRTSGPLRMAAPVMVASLQLLAGDGRAAEPTLQFADVMMAAVPFAVESVDDGAMALLQVIGVAQLVRAKWTAAERTLRTTAVHARARGSMFHHAFASALLAELQWRTGRYPEAVANALVDVEYSRTPNRPGAGFGESTLARVDACLGRFGDASSMARSSIAAGTKIAMPALEMWGLAAQGFVEHAARRHSDAMAAFDAMLRHEQVRGTPHPSLLWWHADAAEAWSAGGRRDQVVALREHLLPMAERCAHPWVEYALHRIDAALADGADAIEPLDGALAAAESIGAPLEISRTLLARARCLDGRAAESGAGDRRRAEEILRSIGATSFLPAAGGRSRADRAGDDPRSGDPRAGDPGAWMAKLTKAELRVAMVVGRGLTDRDAADELFVSVKTVDSQLRAVFRKLGIRNRGELANLVGRSAGAE